MARQAVPVGVGVPRRAAPAPLDRADPDRRTADHPERHGVDLEDGLRALGETKLAEEDKLSVMLLLSGFVRSEATLAADITATAQPEVMVPWGRLLAELPTRTGSRPCARRWARRRSPRTTIPTTSSPSGWSGSSTGSASWWKP